MNEFEVLWQGANRTDWALISAQRLRYQDQDAVLTAFTPIARLKQMEQRLELWAKVFEASSESIMITDAERVILTVNRAFCRSTAYEFSEIVGKTPEILCSDHHPDGFYSEIWQATRIRGAWQGELWIRRKSGEAFPVWAVFNSVRNQNGVITHVIATSFDISERKANEQRISHLGACRTLVVDSENRPRRGRFLPDSPPHGCSMRQEAGKKGAGAVDLQPTIPKSDSLLAQHDVLTDLPNRALCIERLNMSLQHAERNHRRVAVLFIDLDRFKNIILDSSVDRSSALELSHAYKR